MAGKVWKLPPIPKPVQMVPPKVDWVSGGKVGEGADVFYSLEGFEGMIANIELAGDAYKDACGYEMSVIAAEIIDDAQDNYVPFRFGHLRDSGGSDEYEPNKGITVADIGMWFGAPPTGVSSGESAMTAGEAREAGISKQADPSEYALVQHEDLSFHHDIGGPKYLERPFLAKVPSVIPRMIEAIAKVRVANESAVTSSSDDVLDVSSD